MHFVYGGSLTCVLLYSLFVVGPSHVFDLTVCLCLCKTRGFHTFSCFGPHVWNSLLQDLRHCSTLSSFKAKLKTFLFSQYFGPN